MRSFHGWLMIADKIQFVRASAVFGFRLIEKVYLLRLWIYINVLKQGSFSDSAEDLRLAFRG